MYKVAKVKKLCLVCNKEFISYEHANRKFCSEYCFHKYRKNSIPWNKGIPMSEEQKKIISISTKIAMKNPEIVNKISGKNNKNYGLRGKETNGWRGDLAGYFAMHKWVIRMKGRPNKCEHCGNEKAKKYEWSNIDHSYKRILEDYVRLCVCCHRQWDILNNK